MRILRNKGLNIRLNYNFINLNIYNVLDKYSKIEYSKRENEYC